MEVRVLSSALHEPRSFAAGLVFVLALVGCGASSEGATPASNHRVGNFVVYEYAGSYAEQPTTLREEVVAVDGLELEIEVTARRGDELRRWVQVVTDTTENRDDNVVDALYEIVDGQRRELEPSGSELLRLYEWTLPDCGPPVEPMPPSQREVESFPCECQRQQMQCGEEQAVFESCDCPDFVWIHAFAEVRRADDVYWRMQVREHGTAD